MLSSILLGASSGGSGIGKTGGRRLMYKNEYPVVRYEKYMAYPGGKPGIHGVPKEKRQEGPNRWETCPAVVVLDAYPPYVAVSHTSEVPVDCSR